MPVWFDATQHDPSQSVPQLPVGNGQVVIIKGGTRVPVKDKPNSGMLVFDIEVIDGPNKGATGAYRLNMWNENPQASEMASRQLSALCHVTGRYKIETPTATELFGVPFRINVAAQEDARYTQITGVTDINGNQPVKQAAAPVAAPAPSFTPPAPSGPPAGYAPPAAQPSWGGPVAGGGPTLTPSSAPVVAPPGYAPVSGPASQPSWAGPGVGGGPMATPPPQVPQGAPAQPNWSQQPAGGKPSWAQ